jgi:TRAP transporter TAXI family solute receptor
MNFKRFARLAISGILSTVFIAVVSNSSVAQTKTYYLATASTGGTFYPVGAAIASLTKAKLQATHGIGLEAINSAGSEENIHLLREAQAQFAIIQGLFSRYAWGGEGPFETAGPQKELRSVTVLWQNVEQFTLRAQFAKTGTMADLDQVRGKTLALGKRGSGTLVSNRVILGNLGFDIDLDFKLVHAGYGPSAVALEQGQVVGTGTPAGLPTGSVARLKAALGDNVVILSFTAEQATKADGGLGLWSRYVIPANTYPNQKRDINTIAQPNILIVRADVEEETVYQIVKTTYENLAFLRTMHEATKVLSIDRALTGLAIPLHPGAVRFFKEAGLRIPEHLIVD